MPKKGPKLTVVVPFESLDDETAIKHLEHRHAEDLGLANIRFSPEPDREGKPRRFRAGRVPWDRFHEYLHRQEGSDLTHAHEGTYNG